MTAMRAVVALLAALTLVSACGGSDVAAGPASSAGELKPGALVYWQTVSDPDSAQWKQIEELLAKFPDGDRWIAALKKEIASEGTSWEEDVEPALGSVVDVAVYGRSSMVALTNPDDPEKLIALVDRLDQELVTRMAGDWVAVAQSEAALDAALRGDGGEALEDDDSFEDALGELPDDALSRIYVDPAKAGGLAGLGQRSALSMLGLNALDFAGVWAKATERGAELAFTLRGPGAERLFGGEPYASKLLAKVPDDAFAFFTFDGRGLRGQLQELENSPLSRFGLRQFEQELGVTLAQVARIFGGELAFFARPGSPNVELTLLSETDDEAASFATAKALFEAIAAKADGKVTDNGDVVTLSFADSLPVSAATLDGMLVLTTARSGLDDLKSSSAKLPDSERFEDALSAASTPETYTGLAYVDLSEAISTVEGLAELFGEGESVPLELRRNLEPLKTLVAYGKKDGDLATALAFLEID